MHIYALLFEPPSQYPPNPSSRLSQSTHLSSLPVSSLKNQSILSHRSITFGIHICTDLFLSSLLYPWVCFSAYLRLYPSLLIQNCVAESPSENTYFHNPTTSMLSPHSPTWPVSYFHFFRNDCCSRTYMINSQVLDS